MRSFQLLILISIFSLIFSKKGQAQTSGCCIISKVASATFVDENTSATLSSFITVNTGTNSGTGQCEIPPGAIITSCSVTLTNPRVDNATTKLSHINMTTYIAGVSDMKTLNTIGTGYTINSDGLSGLELNNLGINIYYKGNANCKTNDDHKVDVTVSIQVCWTLLIESIYTQGSTGLQNTQQTDCMTTIDGNTNLPIIFVDNGTMASGGQYYSSNADYFRTFCPKNPGKSIKATFNYFDIEPYTSNWWDLFTVYDGPSTVNDKIWTGSGNLPNNLDTKFGTFTNPMIATNNSGCLSFNLHTDASITYGGWYITLTEVDNATAIPDESSDCPGAIATCGNTSFTGQSNGPGLESTCSGVAISENYSTWYFFEVASSGNLELTIDPINNSNDYDFAIFKSSNCNTLGIPVRGSYAVRTDNTGIRSSSVDATEDALGDGWVSALPVTAGDVYVLLVNSKSPIADGYNVNFTLNAGCTLRDCNQISLPIEYYSINSECYDNKTTLNWTTASEINSDYFIILKSTDNAVYKPIGNLKAAGNSNTLVKYTFHDPEPNEGNAYYKLKQYDFDGQFYYSDLIPSNCNNKSDLDDLKISNFQEYDYINLKFACYKGTEYSIYLSDINGATKIQQKFTANDHNASIDLITKGLSSGIYSIRVISENVVHSKKIFIS